MLVSSSACPDKVKDFPYAHDEIMIERQLKAGDMILDTPETEAFTFGPCMVVKVYKELTSGPSSKYVYTFEYLRGDGKLRKCCVYDWTSINPNISMEAWPEGDTGLARDGTRFKISSGWWIAC